MAALDITVSASDGQLTVADTFHLTITPVNDVPVVAATKVVTTLEDTATAPSVIGATDVDGDELNYSLKSGFAPTKGAVAFDAAAGTFTYTPTANDNGTDTFIIVVSDGNGGTTEQLVNVAITPVNDAPRIAAAQIVMTLEDTAASATAIGANDVDGDVLSYAVKSGFSPSKGSVALDATASTFTYTPTANANGTDTFTIVVSDGNGGVSEQVVSISITPVNDAPVAMADGGFSTTSGHALTIPTATLLANDSDVDGNSLTIVAVDGGINGSATLVGGTVIFTPGDGYVGPAAFTYTVSDGYGGTATAMVAIDVGYNVVNGTSVANAINGTSAADQINGLGGNDTISGGAGNDWLDGGTGTDVMSGGMGDDIYIVDSATDVVSEQIGEGVDAIRSSVTYTLTANVENLILTGTAALKGTGNTLDNVITGNSGANTLDGSLGADTLIGGDGNDIYIVDNTADVVVELTGQRRRYGAKLGQLHPVGKCRKPYLDRDSCHQRHRQRAQQYNDR